MMRGESGVFRIVLMMIAVGGGLARGEERPLRWAADAEGGAPYIFQDPKQPSKLIGFEVDIAAALSRELGRPIEHVQYQFDSLMPGLQRGDFDFAMNGVEVTPDRRTAVRFSRPYYIYEQQLTVRASETRIDSLDDCLRLKAVVATLEDTAAERLLDQEGIEKRVYGNQTDPYVDLALGRVDAVLLDLPIAMYYGKPNPLLKLVGEPLAPGYYSIAFRLEDEELAQKVDQALVKLIERGELQLILEKWNIWTAAQSQLSTVAAEDVQAQSRKLWTIGRYFPLLLEGAVVTIQLSLLSMALAILLGLIVAICRLYGPLPLRWLAVIYVEFFRGIPVLLLLFFLYYGLPGMAQYYGWGVSLELSAMTAAIIGFGINYSAYEAEIYRAGIGSIPIGQWEAAASLGMSGPLTFQRIILPQAIRVILPPMTNDFVALFKDTSVVSIIAVVELTKQYQILSKSSLKYLEIGLVTAALYLVMSIPLGYLSRYLEEKWSQE